MLDCRMWIQMKTYDVQNENDVCDILLNNEIDNLENVFELAIKDVKNRFERQNQMGMDFVLLSVCMVPLKIQLINSSISLLRGNKKCYDVYFLNVKNEFNEYFSSVVDTLSENDRILIFNGVLLRNSVTFKKNEFIVNICAENKSSVSLFKYKGTSLNTNGTSSLFSNKTKKNCYVKENIINCSLDGTISPPLFENTPELFMSDHISQSKVLDSTNDKPSISTQSLGPCRLLSVEPNVYEVKDLVSGYCVKCLSFFQKYVLLKSSEKNYNCPKCSSIVQLTFFFKMIFLYGENESQAIEICCYNRNAECVIKTLSKKQIYLEDYLSNDNNRKLIITIMKSLISNKTQVNIEVEKLPIDKSYKLLKICTNHNW